MSDAYDATKRLILGSIPIEEDSNVEEGKVQIRRGDACLFELDIRDFHEKFELHYDGPPRLLPEEFQTFRAKFLQEELNEFNVAWDEGDLEGAFDALIDLVYVAMGTAYLMGVPFTEGWKLVQAANMQKVRALRDGSDSKRGTHYDVVKPKGWKSPDLTPLLAIDDDI